MGFGSAKNGFGSAFLHSFWIPEEEAGERQAHQILTPTREECNKYDLTDCWLVKSTAKNPNTCEREREREECNKYDLN